jgi:hypothetical protein
LELLPTIGLLPLLLWFLYNVRNYYDVI